MDFPWIWWGSTKSSKCYIHNSFWERPDSTLNSVWGCPVIMSLRCLSLKRSTRYHLWFYRSYKKTNSHAPWSLAIGPKPMHDLASLTAGNYKDCTGSPHRIKLPPNTGLETHQAHCSLWKEFSHGRTQDPGGSHSSLCLYLSLHASIWRRPLYQGLQLIPSAGVSAETFFLGGEKFLENNVLHCNLVLSTFPLPPSVS